ncbi:unnamed protein product [Sphenostylis stenocarpa]|uniref:Uncharacterized protein n=1 Tax=Sphenostylis stenocarpa TaxID=92480 RepID=A0AA86VHS4_9FABA|nr:unnamed protein product [Sphenostylis stenocarpa]
MVHGVVAGGHGSFPLVKREKVFGVELEAVTRKEASDTDASTPMVGEKESKMAKVVYEARTMRMVEIWPVTRVGAGRSTRRKVNRFMGCCAGDENEGVQCAEGKCGEREGAEFNRVGRVT